MQLCWAVLLAAAFGSAASGQILATSFTGTVTTVTNYTLTSPIAVGSTVSYSMSANRSSCSTGPSIGTHDAAYFCDLSNNSSVQFIFQTGGGALTFQSFGDVRVYVADAALGAPIDQFRVINYSSTYNVSPAGAWESDYNTQSTNNSYVNGIGFPSSVNTTLATYQSPSFSVLDGNGNTGYVIGISVGPVSPSAPTITSLSPNSATAGGPALTLTVNGSGFLNGSNVLWNGSSLSTSYLNSNQLIASVPAA